MSEAGDRTSPNLIDEIIAAGIEAGQILPTEVEHPYPEVLNVLDLISEQTDFLRGLISGLRERSTPHTTMEYELVVTGFNHIAQIAETTAQEVGSHGVETGFAKKIWLAGWLGVSQATVRRFYEKNKRAHPNS